MRNRWKLIVWLVIIVLLSPGLTRTQVSHGKMPITTSSEQAREYYLQGLNLADKLRALEAREYFEKAVAADPDFALAHLNLAFVQPTNKAFFESFYKARALADKVSEGERFWILAVEAAVNGEIMKQRELFTQLVSMYPDDARAHNLLGNHYFGQQEWALAIPEYGKAIVIDSTYTQPYNQLGYAHRFLGNLELAEKAFQKYIELIPDDPNPYDSYAELLMKMGRFEESIEQYRKALELNPTFAPSHLGIASNLDFLDRHPEARQQLQVLYDSAHDDGQRRAALFAKSVSYADEGDLEPAGAEIQKQYDLAEKIKDRPAMAADLIAMGNILFEAGNYGEALKKYDESVAMMKKSGLDAEVVANAKRGHLYNTGRVALMMGDRETALAKAQEFLAEAEAIKNPTQVRLAHELFGMIAFQQQDYEKAVEELQQANQQNPYNWYRMAQAYEAMGNGDKAKKCCEKAARFNQLNSLNYAFCRHRAEEMLASM